MNECKLIDVGSIASTYNKKREFDLLRIHNFYNSFINNLYTLFKDGIDELTFCFYGGVLNQRDVAYSLKDNIKNTEKNHNLRIKLGKVETEVINGERESNKYYLKISKK